MNNFEERKKRENNYTLYIYVRVTCARRRRRERGKIGICGYEEKKKTGEEGADR